MDDENIFKFTGIKGGKEAEKEQEFPVNDYVVYDVVGDEFYATGFLIFTPAHLAIMKSTPLGAVPALVLPISRVAAAEMVEEEFEEDRELPF